MGRGERAGSKNDGKGQALKRNMKSDDSDEDYMLEEDEADDLSDELESLCGDASDEESLGSFVDEEEEDEIVGNFVKSKSQKRSMGRKKNGIKKTSKKRKRVTNDEEDDDDDYHEDDGGGGARSMGRMKKGISKRSKGRKTIAYDEEEDDEEYHEEDDNSGGERSMGRMKNGISERSKGRKRILYHEDDDDEEYDEEGDGGGGERSMARMENGTSKSSKGRKRISYHEEEDDDEDYDENDGGGFDERSIGRMKKRINRSVKTRQRITYDEEGDDEDYHEDDDGGGGERSMGQMSNGINRSSKKRKRIACDEEEDDEDYHEEDGGGGGGGGVDNDDDDDYDDDGEADDDEFTPDELDFLEEEEELSSSRWKNKKKGRHLMKKKGSGISRKRKTGGNLLKKHGKRKRKGSSRSRKSTSGKSRKSMDKVLSSRSQRKRVPTRRKKKAMPCSDSDFVSSESSDYEFTISEEEREQVREANEFCMRLNSNLRSSKTDQENAAAYNQLRNLPRRKGKEKVEEIKSDVGKQVCGICLTEEGKNTVRGTLNCCNHFFCFACIIEWSKVESRCPLCKQRFLTISKPARSRIDLRDVVIHVPERDQVYQPSEEELRNYLDPYENVICTECHEGGDDALMLLCDLCDSPAHTYCVGLGQEVPEGSWYCEGCKPSALGFTSAQAQDLTPAQRANNSASNEPSSFENMADIDLNITIPETPMTPVNGFLVSPRQPPCGGLQPPAPVSGVGVSTLSGRRRVHRYLLSSNRFSHMAMRVDRATSDRMTNFSGSWEDRAAQSSSFETGATDVGPSYHAEYMDRLQENPSVPAQNRESFSGRLNLMRGQVLQVPSAADGPSYGCMQIGGVGEINLGLNCIPGREYLRPCTSSLNMGSGTSVTPLYNRDVDQNAARQQIQSLVKSQLKNLCRDMDLGHDTLKQIARSSTHTILAACGLEHSRSEAYEVQPPICLHNEALVGPQTSLMKGCCQACFDSFVRDVVRMSREARAPQQLGFRNY